MQTTTNAATNKTTDAAYAAHTPELARLLGEMRAANAALVKVTRKIGIAAFASPEKKAATAAYRAYWSAVDADRAASKATA